MAVTIKQLLEAGVHFGHQTRRWNPKMAPYIFTQRNGIYILNLEKTEQAIISACEFLRQIVARGGSVLFVATKKQAQQIIVEEALRCGMFYVEQRWLGGTLTNFETIRKSIKRMDEIERMHADGTIDKLKKKEVAMLQKEMTKLEKNLKGIRRMNRLPAAMVVVDVKKEETAVREARRLRIPVIGLVDTNSDPDLIDYIIPGNDDAIKSVKLIVSTIAEVIAEAAQARQDRVDQEAADAAAAEQRVLVGESDDDDDGGVAKDAAAQRRARVPRAARKGIAVAEKE